MLCCIRTLLAEANRTTLMRRVHRTPQVCFQALVQSLRLIIRLQMVRRDHDQLGIRQLEQFL
jgi:hypothetical protein